MKKLTKLNIADPGQLDGLEEELRFMERNSQKGAPRVKIDKNHQWLCRFLPVALGPRSTWYARLSFYWVNGRPYLCQKDTAPDFGGTGESDNLYDLIESLLKNKSEKVQRIAQKARPTPQWLTYCLVLERDDGRKSVPTKSEDLLVPYECWHYRYQFSEIYNLFRKGQRRAPLSILDLEKGSDVWLMRTNRGMRFEREDPSPIFDVDSDEKFNSMIERVFDQIDFKVPEAPSSEKIDELCAKLEDEASIGSSRGRSSRHRMDEDEEDEFVGRGNSRHSRDDDDEDNQDDEDDVSYRHASRTSRSGASNRDREYDDEPVARPRQSRNEERKRKDDDEPVRQRQSRNEERMDDDDEPVRQRQSRNEERKRKDDDEPVARPRQSRSEVDEPAKSDEVPSSRLGGRKIDPPPAARRFQTPAVSSVDDEDDGVTDEINDPAPPSESDDDVEDIPPPVSKSEAGAGVTRLSDSLKNKLASFKGR